MISYLNYMINLKMINLEKVMQNDLYIFGLT